MKIELMQEALATEKGVRAEGKGVYVVNDEMEMTVYLDVGHESMSISRVRRLTMKADLLLFETHKGERFYIGADTPVRGMRFAEAESAKLRGAGFMK